MKQIVIPSFLPHFKGASLLLVQPRKTLRIRTVWSAPLLITNWKVSYLNLLKVNFNILASLWRWGDWFESRFVRNPKDRFCRVKAQIVSRCVIKGPHCKLCSLKVSLANSKILTLWMLGIFCAFNVIWFFSKLTFSKNSFRNTIRVSNGLDPD